MQVSIDPHSGFCFGVVNAIGVAERELRNHSSLFCLGDIVHNQMEVDRLSEMGMVTINHNELENLHDCRVLIRAHGEPPETYQTALRNNIELIDASCPIVLHLQNAIHLGYLEMKEKNGQVVIYGKEGHAEVNGLIGQTAGTAIVIGDEHDLAKIDFSRPVRLYSQTTKSREGYSKLISLIREKMEAVSGGNPVDFKQNNSICRQVLNRASQLQDFAARYDVIIFVSGKKSSNGMILYQVCRAVNANAYLASSPIDLKPEWFEHAGTVGICGATSTPVWQMEEMKREIEKINH